MHRRFAARHDGGTSTTRTSRRRASSARLTAVTALIAAVGVACGGGASTAATPRPSPAMTGGSYPGAIIAGADGNLWFTQHLGNRVGRITPRGAVTEFPVGPAREFGPDDIAAGPDGNLWFTSSGAGPTGPPSGRIGRITPTGVVTTFSAGISATSSPAGITAGPDGNLWFTESGANRVGRITPAGVVTEFSAGITANVTGPITAGPDGNLWFAESTGASGGDRIGRITTTGTVTEFPVGANGPTGMTAGPDGNVWFTEGRDRIGRITPQGALTEFHAGISPGSSPAGITAGPDGNLWFTEFNSSPLSPSGKRVPVAGNRIGRITPTGVVTEFSKGISVGSAPQGITSGPDGNLWFTESDASRIGRITPAGVASEFPPTAAILSIRLRGTRSIGVVVRCPSGAARECRGTLSLRLGPPAPPRRPQVRRLRLAPGQRATVVFPLSAVGRRQLKVHRRLAVGVILVPTAHSTAGSVARPAILRVPEPPAVVG